MIAIILYLNNTLNMYVTMRQLLNTYFNTTSWTLVIVTPTLCKIILIIGGIFSNSLPLSENVTCI